MYIIFIYIYLYMYIIVTFRWHDASPYYVLICFKFVCSKVKFGDSFKVCKSFLYNLSFSLIDFKIPCVIHGFILCLFLLKRTYFRGKI